MRPPTTNDRVRVGQALFAMYRGYRERNPVLLDLISEEVGCSRRHLERAFSAFETSPAAELKVVRATLVARCLVGERSLYSARLGYIARRIGYADARTMRRDVRAVWGLSPSELRLAATLHREIASWDGIGPLPGQIVSDAYRRAWQEVSDKRATLAALLYGTPSRTKSLIAADLPRLELDWRWHSQAMRMAYTHLEDLKKATRVNARALIAA